LIEVSKVTKRDGRVVDFDENKIAAAILKALKAVKRGDEDLAKQLSEEVVRLLNERFEDKIPSVENIQDLVEEALIRKHTFYTGKSAQKSENTKSSSA
jgi:anaerobic ribonucleoside-triphosphate reductase